MSAAAVRATTVAAATLLAAGWLALVAVRDSSRVRQERETLALSVAADVRRLIVQGTAPDSAAALAGARANADVSVCLASRAGHDPSSRLCSPSRLDSARTTEAAAATSSGARAPLKDADDWDVIGVVELTPHPGVIEPRGLLDARSLVPLSALFLATGAFLSWFRRTGQLRRERTLAAWGFLAAPLLHLAVFSLLPAIFTFVLALHRWDLVTGAREFVGLANFGSVTRDELFRTTLRNTAVYVLYVPATMALALALALWLDRRARGVRLLRAIVFLPYVSSVVAIALAWQWLFNTDYGFINTALRTIGLPAPDWLGSPATALAALIAVTVWIQVGYQMVVFLAGLQGIPRHYLDAAVVDGAGPWQQFRHVTLPLLRPVILFVMVTGIIGGFQVFTLVYVMTEGGPLHSTDVVVYRIYQTAWEFLRFGEASAMAVVLFAILLALTVVQFRLLGRRTELV
ncbi:MAG TPA: sugar ABC transporter permease [Gemmatimonadales bacterium]|nr:sugar ABC transporter permease [Gemmatimonadales bacterium]